MMTRAERIRRWAAFHGLGEELAPELEALVRAELRHARGAAAEPGLLGAGGMGEVRLLHEPELDRLVACKSALPGAGPAAEAALLREARLTARLNHPGVPPVHALRALPDGRVAYTMARVLGEPLSSALAALAATPPGDGAALGLRRLVGQLVRVAQTVSSAHHQGVVHRDLKPENVLIGADGEVWVIDWGLAAWVGEVDAGAGAGTPGFRAPEQRPGAPADPRVDVYALGVLLRVALEAAPPGPEPLWSLVERATAPDPAARDLDADGLARALGAWLDGVARAAEATAMIQAADALGDEIRRVAGEDPLAARAARERLELEWVQLVGGALRLAPELGPAHARLAAWHRARYAEAEARRDRPGMAAAEAGVALHDRGGDHVEWSRGHGRLTLITEPPGAEVRLERFVPRGRGLALEPAGTLGRTPILDLTLHHGSYLLHLALPGHHPVRYPVRIDRLGVWDGVPPGGSAPTPVRLPPLGALAEGEVYVPAGWFLAGGDERAPDALLPGRALWVDAFVLREHPVTVAEWFDWCNALIAAGRVEEARRHAPQEDLYRDGQTLRPCFREAADGRLLPGRDLNGAVFQPGWPITQVSWRSAVAYAAARAAAEGLPWRLPCSLEREKAARGVDGRCFPWGDAEEPGWAVSLNHDAEPPERHAVQACPPEDRSVYGARGLAGNVRDWCLDGYRRAGPAGPRVTVEPAGEAEAFRMVHGGSWHLQLDFGRAAARGVGRPDERMPFFGLRLARSWPGPTPR